MNFSVFKKIFLLLSFLIGFNFQNITLSPCGNYMTIFYFCCKGALVLRTLDRTECCGRTTYNPSFDMVILN